MAKEYILGVRKGAFIPDGQTQTIEFCNAHLLDASDPAANPLESRGRFPSKVKLHPDSFLRFDKAGEYEVLYTRKGKQLIMEIMAK